MYRFIIAGLVFLCTWNVYPQEKNLRKYSYLKEFKFLQGNDNSTGIFLSNKPVTNREYLTYLFWLESVYIENTEVLYQAVPFMREKEVELSASVRIDSFLMKLVPNNPLLREYVFNPAFLDYPVAGVSWAQAMDFTHWFTDRYNEYALIRKKLLKQDYNQLQENCFNTEASLARQYEGIVDKILKDKNGNQRGVQWNDEILVPAFRLPLTSEIMKAEGLIQNGLNKFSPTECLKWWTKAYSSRFALYHYLSPGNIPEMIRQKMDQWTLNFPIGKVDLNSADTVFNKLGMTPWRIPSAEALTSKQNVEKDRYGHMPYLIIGQGNDKQPYALKRIPGITIISSLKMNIPNESWKFFRLAIPAIAK